jgi:hypothetical protein
VVLNWVSKIQNLKLWTNIKMTHVMCNPWKRIFTFVPLVPFNIFLVIRGPLYFSINILESICVVCFETIYVCVFESLLLLFIFPFVCLSWLGRVYFENYFVCVFRVHLCIWDFILFWKDWLKVSFFLWWTWV